MYSLTCRDSVLVGKAQVWDDAGSLIAEGAFRDGEWTETVRVPGYIIHVPKAEVTKYPEYTVICPQHHFSVEIDPKGPIADKYKRFLEEAEGETNAVVEVRNDEFGLIIMTGTSSTNGLHYRLKIDGKRWKIDYKGNWEKTGNEYLFH